MYELSTLRQAFQAFNIEGLKNKILKSSPAPIPEVGRCSLTPGVSQLTLHVLSTLETEM